MVEVRIRYRKLVHASAMPEVSYSNRPHSNGEPRKLNEATNAAGSHEPSQIGLVFDFEVEDTGPGIPEHLQQEIFKPFVQGDLALSRKHGGTGLGLAICSQLAEMMGGSIVVKSTVDIGSTFTLTIPLRYTKESVPSISGSLARPPSTKAASVASSVQFETFSNRSRLARDVRSTRSGKASVYSQDRDSQLDAPRLVGFSQPYLVDEGLNGEAADTPQELMEKRHYEYKRGGSPLAPIQSVATPLELMDGPDFGVTAAAADSPKETNVARPSPRPLVPPKPHYSSVLVAEDNSVNQQVILRLLELEKVSNVTIAENGEEALDKVRNTLSQTPDDGSDLQPFSLIFMDSESSKESITCINVDKSTVQMPKMDGIESTRKIRELGFKAPIVALTAFDHETNRNACYEAGMNGKWSSPTSWTVVATLRQIPIFADLINFVLTSWQNFYPSLSGERL